MGHGTAVLGAGTGHIAGDARHARAIYGSIAPAALSATLLTLLTLLALLALLSLLALFIGLGEGVLLLLKILKGLAGLGLALGEFVQRGILVGLFIALITLLTLLTLFALLTALTALALLSALPALAILRLGLSPLSPLAALTTLTALALLAWLILLILHLAIHFLQGAIHLFARLGELVLIEAVGGLLCGVFGLFEGLALLAHLAEVRGDLPLLLAQVVGGIALGIQGAVEVILCLLQCLGQLIELGGRILRLAELPLHFGDSLVEGFLGVFEVVERGSGLRGGGLGVGLIERRLGVGHIRLGAIQSRVGLR